MFIDDKAEEASDSEESDGDSEHEIKGGHENQFYTDDQLRKRFN